MELMCGPTRAQVNIAVVTLACLRIKLNHVADGSRHLIKVLYLILASGQGMNRLKYSVTCWVSAFNVKGSETFKNVCDPFRLLIIFTIRSCITSGEESLHVLKD